MTGSIVVGDCLGSLGCELNPEYAAMAEARIEEARASVGLFVPG